jgi:hypothetical protein
MNDTVSSLNGITLEQFISDYNMQVMTLSQLLFLLNEETGFTKSALTDPLKRILLNSIQQYPL